MKIQARAMRTAARARSLARDEGRVVKIIDAKERPRRRASSFNASPSRCSAIVEGRRARVNRVETCSGTVPNFVVERQDCQAISLGLRRRVQRSKGTKELGDEDRKVSRARRALFDGEWSTGQPGVNSDCLLRREDRATGELIPDGESEEIERAA